MSVIIAFIAGFLIGGFCGVITLAVIKSIRDKEDEE